MPLTPKIKKREAATDSLNSLSSGTSAQSASLLTNLKNLSITKQDNQSASGANTIDSIVENYFKKVDSLLIPFSDLNKGLSEIGDSPDKLRPVYRKLSLPVRSFLIYGSNNSLYRFRERSLVTYLF